MCDHGGRDCNDEATNQWIPDSSQEPKEARIFSPTLVAARTDFGLPHLQHRERMFLLFTGTESVVICYVLHRKVIRCFSLRACVRVPENQMLERLFCLGCTFTTWFRLTKIYNNVIDTVELTYWPKSKTFQVYLNSSRHPSSTMFLSIHLWGKSLSWIWLSLLQYISLTFCYIVFLKYIQLFKTYKNVNILSCSLYDIYICIYIICNFAFSFLQLCSSEYFLHAK